MPLSRLVPLASIVAFLGLAIGLGIGWHAQTLLHPQPAAPAEAAAVAAAGETPKKPYVELGQFVIPVVAETRTRAFVLAEITLATGTLEQKGEIDARLPDYRDIAIQSLYGYAATGAFSAPGFDPRALAQHMRGDFNRAGIGPEIRQVLFKRLMLQDNFRS